MTQCVANPEWLAVVRRAENRNGGCCSEREQARTLNLIFEVKFIAAVDRGDVEYQELVAQWVAHIVLAGRNQGVAEWVLDGLGQWHLNRNTAPVFNVGRKPPRL